MIWHGTVTIQLSKLERTEDGRSLTSRPAGEREGVVELTVDVEELVRVLGARALRNKSRRAIGMGGLVKARVTREKEVL